MAKNAPRYKLSFSVGQPTSNLSLDPHTPSPRAEQRMSLSGELKAGTIRLNRKDADLPTQTVTEIYTSFK